MDALERGKRMPQVERMAGATVYDGNLRAETGTPASSG
jgi:hypothetical protein